MINTSQSMTKNKSPSPTKNCNSISWRQSTQSITAMVKSCRTQQSIIQIRFQPRANKMKQLKRTTSKYKTCFRVNKFSENSNNEHKNRVCNSKPITHYIKYPMCAEFRWSSSPGPRDKTFFKITHVYTLLLVLQIFLSSKVIMKLDTSNRYLQLSGTTRPYCNHGKEDLYGLEANYQLKTKLSNIKWATGKRISLSNAPLCCEKRGKIKGS